MRPITGAAIVACLAFAAFVAWYAWHNPRTIVATGSITVTSTRAPYASTTLRTRDVAVGRTVFREVELPGGTWIGCAGDCARAVHDAREGFWDTQAPPRR